MIKQMVLREVIDEDGDTVQRCVDSEELVYYYGIDVTRLSQDEFFDFACQALEEFESFDCSLAKIDVCY